MDELWKWALGALTLLVGGAWAQVHKRIAFTHRRIDRLEDKFGSDIREGFREPRRR